MPYSTFIDEDEEEDEENDELISSDILIDSDDELPFWLLEVEAVFLIVASWKFSGPASKHEKKEKKRGRFCTLEQKMFTSAEASPHNTRLNACKWRIKSDVCSNGNNV